MKKFFLLGVLLCTSMAAFSKDYLELTPDGLIVKENYSAKYMVLEYEGISQDDLFSKISSYIDSGLSKNSKESKMNKVTLNRPSSIIINGYGKNVIGKSDNIIYNMSIMLRDGKVRIDMPTFSTDPERLKGKIFTKNGNVADAKLKKQVEDFFNAIINDIDTILSSATLNSIKNEDNW